MAKLEVESKVYSIPDGKFAVLFQVNGQGYSNERAYFPDRETAELYEGLVLKGWLEDLERRCIPDDPYGGLAWRLARKDQLPASPS